MADFLVNLKVGSQEFDAKIDKARQGLLQMEKECRSIGGTLEYVEDEQMQFVKQLGQMNTAANSARGRVMEMRDAIVDLTSMYKRMTSEEQGSQFGQALKQGIEDLTEEAGRLKDQVNDTNAKIRNLASDTAFTDGLGMMTSVVGNCASAMVAWSGDGKEMEEVIKELAKIQTTINAVESLTKAFQKQNMVLLKNPYVLAATAIVAVGVACHELYQKSQEATEEEKHMAEQAERVAEAQNKVKSSVANSVGEAIGKYQALKAEWEGLSTAAEKSSFVEQNASAFQQLGLKINDVTTAERAFNGDTANVVKALESRARAAAGYKMLEQAYEDYYKKMSALDSVAGGKYYKKAQVGGEITDDERNQLIAKGYNYSGAKKSSIGASNYTLQDNDAGRAMAAEVNKMRNAAAAALSKQNEADVEQVLTKQVEAAKKAIEEGNEGAKASDLVTGATDNGRGGKGGKGGTSTKSEKSDSQAAELADAERIGRHALGYQRTDVVDANGKKTGEQTIADISLQDQLKEKYGSEGGFNPEQMITATIEVDDSELQEEIAEDEALLQEQMDALDITPLATLREEYSKIRDEIDHMVVGTEEWNSATKKLQKVGAKIEKAEEATNVATGEAVKGAGQAGDAWKGTVSAVGSLGGALQQIGGEGLSVAGIIMQAVANVALGFAEALSTKNHETMGPWDWIAAAISGTATMIATIASIKSATSGYAEGGLILPNGSPYQGDNIVARLNAGEGVLTSQGVANAGALASQSNIASGNMNLRTEISGENLAIVIDNNNKRRGRSKTVRY